MLPDGVRAVVKKDSYEVPPIFKMLQTDGEIEEDMMYNTFNMGIGLVLAVAPEDVDTTMELLKLLVRHLMLSVILKQVRRE